jgi:hypothetical protein
MNWLETYGRPLFSYRGAGTLKVNESDRQMEVQFEVAQLFDGRIFCEVKSDSHTLEDVSSDFTLNGLTEYGYKVHASRLIAMSRHASFDPVIYSLRAVALDEVVITTPDENDTEAEFQTRFLVTNFNFFSKFIQTGGFHWEVSARTITLNPLPNHKENTKLIQATKSTGTTSVITVEPTYGVSGLEESAKLATRLCWLLSLAQGCHINWICRESFLEHRLVQRCHNQVPLLPPSGFQLVPSEPDDFDNYIDHCIQVYEDKEQSWQLSILIDMYVRAVMSQPFLVPQGLQLAVLMDYMRGIYARSEGKERLIDQSTFDSIKKGLQNEISQILKNLLPNTKSTLRRKMLRHIGLFQWYPFGDSVKGMAKSLNLDLLDSDIDSFVAERDSLVHRYSFSDGKDPLTAFKEMMSLVSKFLFAILEYEGYFYDWLIPPRGNWSNRKTRLKLKRKSK